MRRAVPPRRPSPEPPSPAAPFADIAGGTRTDGAVEPEGSFAGVPLWVWLAGGLLLWTRTKR